IRSRRWRGTWLNRNHRPQASLRRRPTQVGRRSRCSGMDCVRRSRLFLPGPYVKMAGMIEGKRIPRVALAALMLAIGGAPSARAQDYPNQTVKIVVPFTPGGGVDGVARIGGPQVGEELGQNVIIENRGGAGGMLGAAAVASSPPDGYTLLVGTGSTHGTNSSVYARLTYDPVRDFVPVVLMTTSPLLLVVPPSLPAT